MGPAGVGRSPSQAEPPARLSGDVHISVDCAIVKWKKKRFWACFIQSVIRTVENVGEGGKDKEARGCS